MGPFNLAMFLGPLQKSQHCISFAAKPCPFLFYYRYSSPGILHLPFRCLHSGAEVRAIKGWSFAFSMQSSNKVEESVNINLYVAH